MESIDKNPRKQLPRVPKKDPLEVVLPDSDIPPWLDELFAVALDLVRMTEAFFDFISQPGITRSDFLERSTELLEFYDDYLGILERELEVPNLSSAESEGAEAIRETLLRLYVRLDHDREVLGHTAQFVEEQWPEDQTSTSSADLAKDTKAGTEQSE